MDKPELGEMRSKPNFEVEIKRGNKTMGFTCSMISPGSQQSDETYSKLIWHC
jgi:complement component 1 Q subcomponent-binding protein